MKNVTVSLEDELYREARIAAARANTSVTGLVREFLTVLTGGENVQSAGSPSSRAILETIDRIRRRHPGFDIAGKLTRDEMHSR